MSNPPDVILRHLIPKPKLPFIHQLPNFHLQTKTSIVYTPFHGNRIFFIWSLGFGILNQNGGEIRDWISIHTREMPAIPITITGLSKIFQLGWQDLRALLGILDITVCQLQSWLHCKVFNIFISLLWSMGVTVTLNRRFQKHFLHSCSFKTEKRNKYCTSIDNFYHFQCLYSYRQYCSSCPISTHIFYIHC